MNTHDSFRPVEQITLITEDSEHLTEYNTRPDNLRLDMEADR